MYLGTIVEIADKHSLLTIRNTLTQKRFSQQFLPLVQERKERIELKGDLPLL